MQTNREIESCVPTKYILEIEGKIYAVTVNLNADSSKPPTQPLIEMQERRNKL
jgi:hypothetical protein